MVPVNRFSSHVLHENSTHVSICYSDQRLEHRTQLERPDALRAHRCLRCLPVCLSIPFANVEAGLEILFFALFSRLQNPNGQLDIRLRML